MVKASKASTPALSHPRLPSYGGGATESAVVLRLPSISVSSSSASSASPASSSTTLKIPRVQAATNGEAQRMSLMRRVLEREAKCLDVQARMTLPKLIVASARTDNADESRRKSGAITEVRVAHRVSRDGEGESLAAAPALLTATEFMSGSVDDEAMLMDLKRSIEDILDRVELAIGHGDVNEGSRDEELAESLSVVELRELISRCEMLRDRGLLHRIGKDDLVKILEVLEITARASDKVLIEAHETLRDANAQRLLKAVESLGAYFVILSAGGMPKDIFREEVIDRMIERAKHHLVRNVFVFYDAGLWNVHRVDGSELGATDNIMAKPGSSKKTNRDGTTPMSTATSRKSFCGGGCKVADAVGIKIGVIFTHLADLISRLTLPDSTVLQLTALAFASFGIENLNFVQLKSVDLVVSIFAQYTEHRGVVIDSILASLDKVPTASRDLRAYNVPYEQNTQIQVLIALLMKCLQSSVEFVDSSSDLTCATVTTDAEATANTIEARSFGSAFKWTNYFWKNLLTRWPKLKAVESELNLRQVIDNALADALACRNLPEWPVANKLVLNLAAQLIGECGLQSKDAKIREIALDFLGKIASRLHADVRTRENGESWRNLPLMGDLEYTDSCGSSSLERALLFAQQDCSRIQAKVDATTDSTALLNFDGASEEVFIMESILIRYLAENNRGSVTRSRAEDAAVDGVNNARAKSSTSDVLRARVSLQTSAIAYHASQFARDAERAGVGFRLTVTPGGTRAMYGALNATMMRVAMSSRRTHDSSLAGLSRGLAKSLCLRLNSRRPLMQQLDRLSQRIIGMLDDYAVLVRTSATRAIGLISDENSRFLDSPELEQALKNRLKDTGTSVRCSVVDVLGRQLMRNVSLANQYYELIEDRVSDISISVRKRVISVLHECLRHPEFMHAQETMKVLAFRILDEDEGIRSHIVRIFREIWFSPIPGELEDDDDDYNGQRNGAVRFNDGFCDRVCASGVALGEDSIAGRARQLVNTAWEVYCLVSRSGKQKLPLLPTFPVVAILSQVLYPSEEEKLDAWVNMESMALTSQRLANQMLQALVESESNEITTNNSTAALPDASDSAPWSIKYAIGLHILTIVDPCLCVPSQDPTYFAVALQPYLKRVNDKAPHVSEKLQCYMSVVYVVTKHAGRLPQHISREIERDLRILLLRHHDKTVIHHTCKALCAVAETQGGKESGTISMLKRFVSIVIDSLAIQGPLNAQQRAYCARSLYVLGNIARFGADIVDAAVKRNECELSISDLLRVFRKTLEHQPEDEYELTRCALGACGDLFVARPEFMFNKDGGFGKGSFDVIMRAALSSGAERGLKEQCLLNLSELIREEESRMSLSNVSYDTKVAHSVLKSAQKRVRDSEKLQIVNGQSDRSIAGGIAQRYWMDILALCVDPIHSVRLTGLHLVEMILRQGLVHPASAFPVLIALQIDHVPNVKRLARKLLKTQYDRHGEFFEQQLTQGVEHAYIFKKRLEMAFRRDKDDGITKQIAKPPATEGFGFVYGMVNSTRTSRNVFLNSLLSRFETTTGASDVLFLRFLASVVVELPFTAVDEALYVVFQLNRVISLKGGLLLEKLTAALARAESKSRASDDDVPNAALKADVELACALTVVLLLKSHVKRAYDLSDARVMSYVPTEATRNAEILKFNENVKFESSIVNATAGETMGTAKRAIETFQELMMQDASDYAEDMFKDSGIKQRRAARKSRGATEEEDTPAVADHENDQDDEDDNNDDGDAYTPLKSAGFTACNRKRKQQVSSVTRTTVEAKSPKRKLRF